jgi:hypothetical protein
MHRDGHCVALAQCAALSDAQDVAEWLLLAETRLGELLAASPKVAKIKECSFSGGTIPSLPTGVTKNHSRQAQLLHCCTVTWTW